MFQDSTVPRGRRPYAFAFSFLFQCLGLALLAAVSIVVAPSLPTAVWTDVLLTPPPPRSAPPPAAEVVRSRAPARFTELVQPTAIPDRVRIIVDDPSDFAEAALPGIPDLGLGPGAGGGTGLPIGVPGPSGPVAPPPPPPVEKPAPQPAAPVAVPSLMQEAKLIHRVQPVYPRIAVQTRTEGTVKLQAVIASDGTIERLEATSGHPLLVRAALEAVKQWRYRPTILNGQAVPVATQIDVRFRLR